MQNRFTIRAQKDNETKEEYMNYIMEEVKMNMPFEGQKTEEGYSHYIEDVSVIASMLNEHMYPEERGLQNFEECDRVRLIRNIRDQLRTREKDETDVDYMNYIMEVVKERMPFSTEKEGEERQVEYKHYIEKAYQLASAFYETLNQPVKDEKKRSKTSSVKGKEKKKEKKKATKKRTKKSIKNPFSFVGFVLNKISKFFFYIDPESLSDLREVDKQLNEPDKNQEKTKTRRITTSKLQKKGRKSNDSKLDEEEVDLLEIDQRLTEEALVTAHGYMDNISTTEEEKEVVLEEIPVSSMASESVSLDEDIVVPSLVEETPIYEEIPAVTVTKTLASGEVIDYTKRESSVLEQKREYNDSVENYVQNCMIPGPITDDMNMADILDVMYPTSHKPLEYEEIQEYVELWQWELSMKEEHEKHAKVLTK